MARRPESEVDKFKWWVSLNTLTGEAVVALDNLDDLLEENPGAVAELGNNCRRDLEKALNKLREVWDQINAMCKAKKGALENQLPAAASGEAGPTGALAEGNADLGPAAAAGNASCASVATEPTTELEYHKSSEDDSGSERLRCYESTHLDS